MWACSCCCSVQTGAPWCLFSELKKKQVIVVAGCQAWSNTPSLSAGLTSAGWFHTNMVTQLSWLQIPAEQACVCPQCTLSTRLPSAHQASDKILKVLDVFLGCTEYPLLLFTLMGTEQHLSTTHCPCCIMEVQDVSVQYFCTQWITHYSVAQWGVDGFDFLARISSVSELAHAASVSVVETCTGLDACWFIGLKGETAGLWPHHSLKTWRES